MTSYFNEDIEILVTNFGLQLRYILIKIYNYFFNNNQTYNFNNDSDSSDELEDINIQSYLDKLD